MRMNKYAQMHKERLEKTLDFLPEINPTNILDIGGYNGKFASLLREKYPSANIYITDITPDPPMSLNERTIYKKCGDLNTQKLPFESESFDLITCLEVIEHLYNPDNLIEEIKRVLKPGKVLILSTPNLASWSNRLLLLLGYFPISMSISLKSERTGKRDILNKEEKSEENASFDYHVRVYTYSALKILLELHRFDIRMKGSIYGYKHQTFWLDNINMFIERFIPSFAQTIIIVANKSI